MPPVLSFRGTYTVIAGRLLIVFFAFVYCTLSTPVQPTIIGTPLRKTVFAYVLIDHTISEEAVQTIWKVAVQTNQEYDSPEKPTLRVVDVSTTGGGCSVVRNSSVVHVTRLCLPSYDFRLRSPVLSVLSPGYGVHASGLMTHVSFGHGDSAELPVILAAARKLNWTSAVYVGDTSAETSFLDRLLRRVRTFELFDVVPVKEDADPVSLYARIKAKEVDCVLLHCQTYFCYDIVKKLFHFRNEMADQTSSVPWVMTEALTQNFQSSSSPTLLAAHATTYGLQKTLPNSPHSDLLLEGVPSLERLHHQCTNLEHCPTTIQQQMQVLNFHDSLVVLLHLLQENEQMKSQPSGSHTSFINEANLHGISGHIHFDTSSSERTEPALYNVLDISPFVVTTIGVYDISTSGWFHKLSPVRRKTSGRRGRYRRAMKKCCPANGAYRVTTMIEPPFVIYDPDFHVTRGAHNGPYTGLVVDMMELLRNQMGFTYNMLEPPDLKYGSINEHGEGNGMVGQLMNCQADLAAAAFAITLTRSRYIHFTKPYIDVPKSLLGYKGEAAATSLWAFLNPFDFTTKLVIAASFFVVSFVFAMLGRLSPYRQSDELESTDGRQRSAVVWRSNSLWLFYATAMQQGPDAISSVSGKILVAAWYFFCLVVVATYTANLAAFLTVKSFVEGIHSLDELAAQTETVYGTVRDTSVIDFFKNSPIDAHQRMYRFMTHTDGALVDSVKEATTKVQNRTNGDYVFIWDDPILNYIASRAPCTSQVVGRPFNSQGYGLAMPQGMPYQLNFSLAILNMRESGDMERLVATWLDAGDCTPGNNAHDLTDVDEVRISDMLGVFVILSAAVGASILAAIVERLWWNVRKQRTVGIAGDLEGITGDPDADGASNGIVRVHPTRDFQSESD